METTTVRAVLFDFGGTLYDYATLEPAERESLLELVRWAGVDAEPAAVLRAHREALRRVFHGYLPRRFYLHRDLFRPANFIVMTHLFAYVRELQRVSPRHAGRRAHH